MNDKFSKLERQRQRALAAQETYASSLVRERDVERKRRNGRLMKVGIVALQFVDAGDLALLSRIEQAVMTQFKTRKTDRLDFALEEESNWFDQKREELLLSGGTGAVGTRVAPAEHGELFRELA